MPIYLRERMCAPVYLDVFYVLCYACICEYANVNVNVAHDNVNMPCHICTKLSYLYFCILYFYIIILYITAYFIIIILFYPKCLPLV